MGVFASAAGGQVSRQTTEVSPARGVPEFLRLGFSGPLETPFADARIVGVGDRALRLPVIIDTDVDPNAARIRLPGAIAPGGYTVYWRIMSADGHAVTGDSVVRVGAGNAPPAAAANAAFGSGHGAWIAAIGRTLVIAGAVVALGLVALRWVIADPAAAGGGLRPPGPARDEHAGDRMLGALAASMPSWWRRWSLAVTAWFVGAVMMLVGTLPTLGLAPSDLGVVLGDTRFGRTMLVISGAAVIAAVAGAALIGVNGDRRRSTAVALAAPPAAVIVAMSWLGHASLATDRTLNIGVDAVHTAATAAWIGGLVGLGYLVITPTARLALGDGVAYAAAAVVRFSSLAVAAVAVLVVTGVYRALAEVGALGDLTGTVYGRVLLIKLGLFAGMLVLGGYNRFVVHPRLERAALGLPGGDAAATRLLGRSIRAELGFAAALIATVGILVSTAPPG
ncbi:MAG: copper resistance protein CopC/CopD [Thermoleophilia bacterium]|nr:copper resistance protein CopC/CopD [Thermoleophilia bacterium]